MRFVVAAFCLLVMSPWAIADESAPVEKEFAQLQNDLADRQLNEHRLLQAAIIAGEDHFPANTDARIEARIAKLVEPHLKRRPTAESAAALLREMHAELLQGEYVGRNAKVFFCPGNKGNKPLSTAAAKTFIENFFDPAYTGTMTGTYYYRAVVNTAKYNHGSYQYITRHLNSKYKRITTVCYANNYAPQWQVHDEEGLNGVRYDGSVMWIRGGVTFNSGINFDVVNLIGKMR